MILLNNESNREPDVQNVCFWFIFAFLMSFLFDFLFNKI